MRTPPLWRHDSRWLLLPPLAGVHAWTMTHLAWVMVPTGLVNPQFELLGRDAALLRATLGAMAAVAGGAMLAAAIDRLRQRHAGGAGTAGTAAIALGGAVAGAAGLIVLGPLGAASVLLAAAAGGATAVHRLVGRYFPALATVGAGLWHAVAMAIPDPRLSFGWPALLALTHVVVLSALTRTYGLDRPGLPSRAAAVVVLGWAFAALLIAGGMTARGAALLPAVGPGGRWTWLWPAAAAGGFVVTALVLTARAGAASRSATRPVTPRAARREAVHRVAELGTWWLMVYQASWLLGAGLWGPAAAVLALAAALLALHGWWTQPRAAPTYRLP